MALQFGTIAKIVTGLVEGAQLLSSGAPAKGSNTTDEKADVATALEERVSSLERHEADQGVLVEQLAVQLKELAAAGDRLNRRAMSFFILSGIALFLSVVSLLLTLFWR
ncbi:MAG: hypothetical protein PF636_01070 [Actinomycetota bacterium]|nr:hypothetical protein [Actinomycetota bacterium]